MKFKTIEFKKKNKLLLVANDVTLEEMLKLGEHLNPLWDFGITIICHYYA